MLQRVHLSHTRCQVWAVYVLDLQTWKKDKFEVDRDLEMQRLQKLDGEVTNKFQLIETIFQNFSTPST